MKNIARMNEIALAMEAAAKSLGASSREVIDACTNLSLKSHLDAGLHAPAQVIPFHRPLRAVRYDRNLGRRTPLDCA